MRSLRRIVGSVDGPMPILLTAESTDVKSEAMRGTLIRIQVRRRTTSPTSHAFLEASMPSL